VLRGIGLVGLPWQKFASHFVAGGALVSNKTGLILERRDPHDLASKFDIGGRRPHFVFLQSPTQTHPTDALFLRQFATGPTVSIYGNKIRAYKA
jgi:hypothetical protein